MMLDWSIHFAERHAGWFIGLTLFSVFSAIVTVAIGTKIIERLPTDYFLNSLINSQRRRESLRRYPLVLRILLPVIRNLLGFIFIVSGILMLVLPGQGVLTLVAGILLMNFPGKFALESWLIRRKPIRNGINWLRHRAGAPPLILENASGHVNPSRDASLHPPRDV